MENQITLEEALRLVSFQKDDYGKWYVHTVFGYCELVKGNCGTVKGDCFVIDGTVFSTIKGRKWQFIETPAEKLERLIVSNSNLKSEMKDEMIKTLNEIIN